MNPAIQIRRYHRGEEELLFPVYYSAIHLVASHDYTPEQIQAWAPADPDMGRWANRIRGINPYVAVRDGEIVGYADLQDNGYIDHFFVSGKHPRSGIGSALMQHIFAEARTRGLTELSSDVSLTAQPFYEKFGFLVIERRKVEIRSAVLPNALMRRAL